MTERLLRLSDVAAELDCSVATVKRRIREGALPTFRDGRIVRVRESDLTRYVLERVALPAPEGATPAAGRALAKGARLWDV